MPLARLLCAILVAALFSFGIAAPAAAQSCRSARLNSSALSAAEWCGAGGGGGTLFLTFTNGRTYAYSGVPAGTFRDLVGAPSAGRYYHSHIRGQFPSRPIR